MERWGEDQIQDIDLRLKTMLVATPALQVVIPLLAAPICVFFRNPRIAWLIALIASSLTFMVSIGLFLQVQQLGVISYEMGNWAPPWGIEYRVDNVNAYILLIVSSIGALVTVYAYPSLKREIDISRHYLFWTSYLLCLTGLLGVTITGDALTFLYF